MKISHISRKVNETDCLTHFLHLKDAADRLHIVNLLTIQDVEFQTDKAYIHTTKYVFTVTDEKELADLRRFFQVL